MTRRAFVLGLALGSLAMSAALAAPAHAAGISVCTGSSTGNYTAAAKEIFSRVAGRVGEVRFVTNDDNGGSLDNLRKLSAGQCDFAFTQSDVFDTYRSDNPATLNNLIVYRKVYTEFAHVLCSTGSGWGSLADLETAKKKGQRVRMIVGPDGSGSAETWRTIRRANSAGLDGIERVADPVNIEAVSAIKDRKDTCMLWVSGLGSPNMELANRRSVNTRDGKPAFRLITVNDDKIYSLKDPNGEPIYTAETIESKANGRHPGIYNNLLADNGWLSTDKSVKVPTVEALLVTRQDLKQQMPRAISTSLDQAVEDASSTIWATMSPGAANK
ncbi:TAXI family TRAP transporter solute-binding subunit [Methylobacterium ajmalii]|uniref:TAXI family TRAP transporter solute-binding subunit n=1 Tax=Methylobacterium ajmalii TaxID=2738439 RepID=A0ABV0A6D6_9HYPH